MTELIRCTYLKAEHVSLLGSAQIVLKSVNNEWRAHIIRITWKSSYGVASLKRIAMIHDQSTISFVNVEMCFEVRARWDSFSPKQILNTSYRQLLQSALPESFRWPFANSFSAYVHGLLRTNNTSPEQLPRDLSCHCRYYRLLSRVQKRRPLRWQPASWKSPAEGQTTLAW